MRLTLFALLAAALLGLGACGGGDGNDRSANPGTSSQQSRFHNPGPKEVKRQIAQYRQREDPKIKTSVRSWLHTKLTGAGGNKAWYAAIKDIGVQRGRVAVTIASGGRTAARSICDVIVTAEIDGITRSKVLSSPGKRLLKKC